MYREIEPVPAYIPLIDVQIDGGPRLRVLPSGFTGQFPVLEVTRYYGDSLVSSVCELHGDWYEMFAKAKLADDLAELSGETPEHVTTILSTPSIRHLIEGSPE